MRKKKLRVGFYPYTYARVSSMKGLLLPRNEYEKLLKAGLNDVIKYLEEREYKREIDDLATKYSDSGVELMEAALTLNLERTLAKLRRISNPALRVLVDYYLKRWDVYNIKTILRGKYTGASKEEIEKAIVAGGNYTRGYLEKLIEKETVEDVIEALKIESLKGLFKEFEQGNVSLFAIENLLDYDYYNEMLEVAKRVSKQGKLFGEFIRKEIDIVNITMIIRLKREGMKAEEIKKYLFTKNTNIKEEYLDKLLKLESADEILEELTKRHALIKRVYVKEKAMVDLEIELKRVLYEDAVLLLHQHPLTINVILGYMFTKEMEVNNLKILIKAKQLGVNEEVVRQGIVLGR